MTFKSYGFCPAFNDRYHSFTVVDAEPLRDREGQFITIVCCYCFGSDHVDSTPLVPEETQK